MRTKLIRRSILVSVGLLVALSMTACAANTVANGVGLRNGHTVAPKASPTTAGARSSPSAGVENLPISSAGRSELTATYAASYAAGLRVPVAELGAPAAASGSVYYAYDPATDTYWALATFEPTAPYSAPTAYMDGTSTGMFKKVGAGPWQVSIPINPDICEELQFFPQPVLTAWAMPTTTPAGLSC